MRVLFVLLFILLLAVLAPVVWVVSSLQDTALVAAPYKELTADDVARIRVWAKANNPNRLRTGEVAASTLTQHDLNLAIRHVLPLAYRQHTRIVIDEDHASLDYTFRLPTNPVGHYLNLAVALRETDGTAEIASFTLGGDEVPALVWRPAVWLVDTAMTRFWPEYGEARQALEAVHLRPTQATLVYRWDWDLVRRLEQRGRDYFVSPQDRVRAIAYYRVLSDISHEVGPAAPLQILLEALFNEAAIRSEGGDAAAENRMLLLVMGTVLRRTNILRVIGGTDEGLGRHHRDVKWTLHRRGDLARHFAISAAVAATGSRTLADAVGVIKELYDADVGSGFSFVDLLADRAGVALATAATGEQARQVQTFLRSGAASESDFMPAIDNLPESMMRMAFQDRYHNLDDARFQVVKAEIDRRIEALSLYR